MIRKTERIECKYPEYPKFLDGTHTYKYIGNSTVPEGDLLLTLGEIEDKIEENRLILTEYAIGQKVYFIKNDYIVSGNIIGISIDVTKDGVRKIYTIEQNSGCRLKRFEENIFLTYKKAEERLEELGEKEDG